MINKKSWFPLLFLFIILNAAFKFGRSWLAKKGVDYDVLVIGNLILFVATALSFIIYLRSLRSTTTGSSIRGMYGSFIIKFFTCLIAAFVYIMVAKKDVNKPGLFICMGLYIIYTIVEVSSLQKLLKQKVKSNPGDSGYTD